MTALNDRRQWLAHLRECCTRCPANRCHKGDELAAAVRETLTPGESWQGVYRPRETEHGPARSFMRATDESPAEYPRLADKAGGEITVDMLRQAFEALQRKGIDHDPAS